MKNQSPQLFCFVAENHIKNLCLSSGFLSDPPAPASSWACLDKPTGAQLAKPVYPGMPMCLLMPQPCATFFIKS